MTKQSFPVRRTKTQERRLVFLLCIAIGLIAGLAAVVLKTSVHYIEAFLLSSSDSKNQNWLFIALPLIGIFLTVLFIRLFIKEDISHGVTQILSSISLKNSRIKKHNMYSSIVGSTLTSGFGGSVGMEAPILYTGAAIGSNLGQAFNLNYKNITLLIGCGTAGALAAIFKAPITGMIFAMEVLMLDLTATSIIPLLITTVTATILSTFLLGEKIEFYFTIKDVFNPHAIPFYLLLGVFTGLVSLYFTKAYVYVERQFGRIDNWFVRIMIGGLSLGILIFLFPPLFGEGYTSMKLILSGKIHELLNNSLFYNVNVNEWMFVGFLIFILLFKVIATAATTGSGGIGGIFAPSLFMGGIAGFTFVRSMNMLFPDSWKLSENNFTLVGMAGLIAGVIHAPLTAIFLIAEITGGYELFIPLIITASISYLTIKLFEPHSIYAKKLAQRGELITHHKDKAILTLLKVSDLIEKNFSTVKADDSLGDLVRVISSSTRNTYPVVSYENDFLGMISLDDVRNIMFDKDMYNTIQVRSLMVQPIAIVSPEDTMESVMETFKDTGLWNLPVLNDGKYLGFVSRANVFNAYRKLLIEFSEE